MGSYLMNIKQVARLLNDIGVETVATNTSLRPEIDYGVNYYMLKLNDETGKWEFIYVPHERRNFGGEEIEKSFNDEAGACKYYYLIKLRSYFFYKYIRPFRSENKDINIGRPGSELKDLKEILRRLNIKTSYYSLNGKIREHSMFLETINNEESKVYFMGRGGKEVDATLVLDNWEAYSEMYRTVYYLYLLDQYYADLIKNKEIGDIFTDEDYKVILDGR